MGRLCLHEPERRGACGVNGLPIPPRVAALPRTAAGIPVTWTAAWTSELAVDVRPDPLLRDVMGVAAPAYFSAGAPGEGDPRITYPEPARVRRAVIEGLCQVC